MANKSKFVTLVEYIPLRMLMEVLSFFPYRLVVWFGRGLGFLTYYFSKEARHVSLINLKQAFPDKSLKERKKIAIQGLQSMMSTFAELIKTHNMSNKAIMKRLTVEGREKFDKLLERGKGIVVITGHIGNWEYVAFYFGIMGYLPRVVIRGLDNRMLHKYLVSWREKRGSICVDRRGDLTELFRALRSNQPIAFLCDQNYLEGVWVDFFGYTAATATGPVAIALKTGSPIVFLYDRPDKNGHHKVVVSDEFILEKKDTKEETIKHNTARFTKELENIIRKNPDIWLWAHPRWNTRPNNEPELFYKHNNYK